MAETDMGKKLTRVIEAGEKFLTELQKNGEAVIDALKELKKEEEDKHE